jgi:hypothetical protein
MSRVPALALALLSLPPALLGLALLPPILGPYILAAGQVEPGTQTTAAWVSGVGLLILALLGLRRAARLWKHAARIDARRVQFGLLTACVGGVALLGLMELFTRVATTPEDVLDGEDLHRYQWVAGRKLAPQGDGFNEDYPDRYDAALGWVPSENHRSARINVNSRGLRGTREHGPKRAGEKRIVIIGDSFTWGQDVADSEVYSEVLERMLRDTSVINLGVHGYGTDQQFLRLKAVGFDYDPDLVILSFYKSNADRNVLSFRSYAKPRFRLVGGELRLENVPVPAPDDPRVAAYDAGLRLHVWELFKKTAARAVDHTRFDRKWELTCAILDAAREETRERGVPFLLVYIPAARPQFSRGPEATEAVLAAWAAREGVPFLNLRPKFLALPEDRRDRLYAGHWTPEGHRAAATFIAERIAAEGWLD